MVVIARFHCSASKTRASCPTGTVTANSSSIYMDLSADILSTTIITDVDKHWSGQRLVACTAPRHFLNQCWLLVSWTLRNKLQWSIWKCLQNAEHFVQASMCWHTVPEHNGFHSKCISWYDNFGSYFNGFYARRPIGNTSIDNPLPEWIGKSIRGGWELSIFHHLYVGIYVHIFNIADLAE